MLSWIKSSKRFFFVRSEGCQLLLQYSRLEMTLIPLPFGILPGIRPLIFHLGQAKNGAYKMFHLRPTSGPLPLCWPPTVCRCVGRVCKLKPAWTMVSKRDLAGRGLKNWILSSQYIMIPLLVGGEQVKSNMGENRVQIKTACHEGRGSETQLGWIMKRNSCLHPDRHLKTCGAIAHCQIPNHLGFTSPISAFEQKKTAMSLRRRSF